MFGSKLSALVSTVLIMWGGFNLSVVRAYESLQLAQILEDDIGGVDGLGNPRNVKVLSDDSKVFVSSGDDNALAVFNADADFHLTFSQIFRNTSEIVGLQGASGVAEIGHGSLVVVSGFYDSALTLFSKNGVEYDYGQTISDGFSYQDVFGDNPPEEKLDILGLLGAWEVISSNDEKQLLVASYMSDAISILDITQDKNVAFNRKVKGALPFKDSLGKPVSLALSPSNDELYVLGFEKHQLTIFARSSTKGLAVKQVLTNGDAGVEQLINPQKLVVSPDGELLYIACAGSNTIVVFHKIANQAFAFLQAVNTSAFDGTGLQGASSLAISSDGLTVYAAGETGAGIYWFSVGDDGRLSYKNKLLSVDDIALKGISSMTLTEDNKHLLVATGKGSSLLVLKVIEQIGAVSKQ